jgi:Uma2 family endonuclease
MSALTIQLPTQAEQTKFNLRRWAELLADPDLARWEGRVETDRHGYIIMSPPPAFDHGDSQFQIGCILQRLLPDGRPTVECPISTPDGVKIADVAWISSAKLAKIGRKVCLTAAPEICVEVVSPKNTRREMAEKKALYFAAGAEEVWFCDKKGRMTFFPGPESAGETASRLCPAFPALVPG